MATRQTDFLTIGNNSRKSKISSKDTPREGNPDLILDLVRLLQSDKDVSHKEMSIGSTAFEHVLQTSRLLCLVDEKKRLTKAGRGLLTLGKSGQYSRLALSLDKLPIVKSWCKSFEVQNFCELDYETCYSHLKRKVSGIKQSTLKGRVTALKRLCKSLEHHHPSRRDILFADQDDSSNPKLKDEPIFGKRVIDVVNRIKEKSTNVRVSTGWMSAQGYDMIANGLREANMKILLGSDDYRGKELLESPIEYFRKSVKLGKQNETKKNQHIRLYQDLASGTKRIRELSPRILDRLHAKGYYFGLQAGLSTSANMTWNGLVGNVESGHVTTSLEHMKYNITEYEKYFEMAEDITTPILEAIEESWIFQEPVEPYLAYLRGLLEIFGNIAEEKRSETYQLADFQKMIVASALNSLNDYGRAMLISPTGTGKTVMGSYIVAAESINPKSKVIIISPNDAVRRKWEYDTLAFGRTPKIYSHSDIQSLPENHLDSQVGREFHMFIDEHTLIVVDEVHRFRTEGRIGETNLRKILDGGINGKMPRVLFLTATPIGVGFENLETQYSMLFGNDKISNVSSIASLPGLVNITLPFIIEKFGLVDDEGRKYLNYSNSKKYFANRTQYTVAFQNDNENLFSLVENLKLTRLKANPVLSDGNRRLEDFGVALEPIPDFVEVEDMTFAKFNLARAISSSKSAAIDSVNNFLSDLSNQNYADKEVTKQQLNELLYELQNNFSDVKYQKLLTIIKANCPCKLLIFTGRKATMRELEKRLSIDLPNLNVKAHQGTDNQKQKLREQFAPIAHGVKIRKNKRIDILISTDSISEGVDLQDANIAIDYDLWWTPLVLQQRMGRLDRPTDKFREFKVIRFVNLSPKFTSMVKIHKYLSERSNALKALIADGAYEEYEHRDWNDKHEEGIVTVKEDENPDIISSDDLAGTSFHIADLASATQDELEDARKLPSNFHSSITKTGENGTMILFKNSGVKHLAYLNHDTGDLDYSPGNSASENIIEKIRCERGTRLNLLPPDHSEKTEHLMDEICRVFEYDVNEVELIFSIAIRNEFRV